MKCQRRRAGRDREQGRHGWAARGAGQAALSAARLAKSPPAFSSCPQSLFVRCSGSPEQLRAEGEEGQRCLGLQELGRAGFGRDIH